ncbi:hypothetical protein BH09BAC5_BH09BAC5_03320 [soil metagenome]
MKTLYTILALSFFSIGASAQCTITSGPTITPNGLTISATGTGTGATIPGYGYDWGDMTTPATTQNASHTYAVAGVYTVCMIYVDIANSTCFDSSCVTATATGISDPSVTSLNLQAIPNPFSSDVSISLTLAQSENVVMNIYDITGKQVASLENGMMNAGNNTINWKPTGLSAGVYFLQVKAGDVVLTKKLVYTMQN